MSSMLSHPDSPYIRCIGFLYLRYACEPNTLWKWFEPFLHDEEPVFILASHRKEETIGQFLHDLLTEMDYHGTLLPRLPLNVERDIKVKLLLAEKIEDRAKKHLKIKGRNSPLEFFQVGARIRALYGDDENPTTWYDGIIDNVIYRNVKTGEELSRPLFVVTFPEYGNTETVTLGEVDFREDRDVNAAHNNDGRNRCDRLERFGKNNEVSSYHSGDDSCRYERYDRQYEKNSTSHSHRDGSYEMDCHSERRGRYMGENGNPHSSRRYRSRSREREPDSHGERNQFRTTNHNRSVTKPLTKTAQENELLEEVLRRERDKSAAKGKAYAVRPPTFKKSLASKDHVGSSLFYSERDQYVRSREKKSTRVDHFDNVEKERIGNNSMPEVTAEKKAAIEKKKEKLLARYG